MNLNYVCKYESIVYQTQAYGRDARLLSIWINCPTCGSEITLLELPPIAFKVVRLSPEELFKASQGNGLPHEKVLTEDNITRILIDGKIVGVDLDDPTPQRVILNALVVEYEGKTLRMHFGVSNKGAALFKIVTEVK